MRRFKQIAVAAAATFALIFGSAAVPAQAVETPAFNISLAGGNLSTSTLSGFGADQLISMTLTVPSGELYFNTGASTASLISSNNPASSLLIQGTQDQLLTAFGAISLTAGCGGGLSISATVESGGGLKNVFNGHYYRLVKTQVSFDDAVALSAATTFDGTPSGTPGYLATITSPEENQFLFTVMGGAGNNAWLGASDRDVEGDWKWMTGPEAGTSFYTGNVNEPGNGPVNGEFSGWAGGEPNQAGDEDYAEVYGDGRWNDIPSNGGPQNFYLIEWGGYPGDDFSSSVSLSDSDTLAAANPFAVGDGTEASPYEVSTLNELSKVGECSGDNVYFKQTADFNLTDADLNPIGTSNNYFTGVYDGNNHKIEGILIDSYDDSLFGYVGNGPVRTVIKNLELTGSITLVDEDYAGLVTNEAYNADFLNLDVDVTVVTEEWARYIGGVAGYAEFSTFNDINVSGTMQLANTTRVGGVVGQGYGIEFANVTSDVDFTAVDSGRMGGIAGRLYDNSELERASFTGSFNLTSAYDVGGLVGYMDTGTVWVSYSTGDITSINQGSDMGGLIGETYEVQLTEVFATGNLLTETSYEIGGLIGRAEYTNVTDAYATGDVTAEDSVGALIGFGYDFVGLRVHAIGTVTTPGQTNGLFGYNDGGNSAEDSVWSPDFVGVLEANISPWGNESAVTLAQAKDIATYQAKNWTIGADAVVTGNTWTICADFNEGTPFLSFAYPNACLEQQVLKPVPTITGSGAALAELTAVPGTWDDGTTLSYTWYADGVEIAGATSGTYTPTLAQIGAQITVKVTSTKEGFVTESATSSPVGPISPAALTLKPVPTITGSGTVGQELTANPGTWDADVVLTYKWFLNGVEIAGATMATFTPTKGQIGGTISVQVTGTKVGYVTESKTSTSNKKVKAVVVPVTSVKVSFGGMTGNSWWMTDSMKAGVRAAVKANSKATNLVCVGIVKPGGTKAWMKTLGLKRAEAGCWIAKLANPKLNVTYSYVISKPADKVQRGFTLTFNK